MAKGKTTEETAYFTSSLPAKTPAAIFAQGIRGHWGTEAMHYTKDVTFKEDASKTRTKQAPQNISLLKNVVINIFKQAGYQNMAQAVRLVANDIPQLWRLLSV